MKNTKTLMGEQARVKIVEGVRAIYEPVRRTLGPHGRSALIYRTHNRGSRITDDGVTVAEVQEPKDPHTRLVADTFKEMCKRTVEKVGDGTTTTAVIGGKLILDGIVKLGGASTMTAKGTGTSAKQLHDELLTGGEKVKEQVKARAVSIGSLEDLERVAVISAKDEKIGKVVAKMSWEVGVDGHIDVVEGYKGEIETDVIKGMRFPAKVPAKVFVNNPKRYEMVAENCPVLVTNYPFDNGGDVAPLLSKLNQQTSKIIVIAPSFSQNVLLNMVSAFKEGYHIFPVAVPGLRTEQFEDLAVFCDANFCDKNKGGRLSTLTLNDCGRLEKLIVKDTDAREDAVATGGRGTLEMLGSTDGEAMRPTSKVAERIAVLKEQVKEQKEENFKKLLERRIASMAAAVGVIRVGDSTNASALFWKLKIEDCVYACKAALRGGYVKGGGLCLKEIAEELLPEGDMLRDALIHPYTLIQHSVAGGIEIGDEVIDPAEAIYYAVEHATDVAAKLLMVDVLTPEIDEASTGDATMAVARMMGEVVVSTKRYLGQLNESQEEAERDRLQGLTIDEKIMLDEG